MSKRPASNRWKTTSRARRPTALVTSEPASRDMRERRVRPTGDSSPDGTSGTAALEGSEWPRAGCPVGRLERSSKASASRAPILRRRTPDHTALPMTFTGVAGGRPRDAPAADRARYEPVSKSPIKVTDHPGVMAIHWFSMIKISVSSCRHCRVQFLRQVHGTRPFLVRPRRGPRQATAPAVAAHRPPRHPRAIPRLRLRSRAAARTHPLPLRAGRDRPGARSP